MKRLAHSLAAVAMVGASLTVAVPTATASPAPMKDSVASCAGWARWWVGQDLTGTMIETGDNEFWYHQVFARSVDTTCSSKVWRGETGNAHYDFKPYTIYRSFGYPLLNNVAQYVVPMAN